MSRKRRASDPPLQAEDDPLTRILSVLNETVAARQALARHSQSISDSLHMADSLHRTLLGVHENACQRLLQGAGEQASLQQLTSALNAGEFNLRCCSRLAPLPPCTRAHAGHGLPCGR